jgi:hypothetical protein
MLNFMQKVVRPASLQSLRGVALKPRQVPPAMMARNLSSIMPRRVSNMTLMPQMVNQESLSKVIHSLIHVYLSSLLCTV